MPGIRVYLTRNMIHMSPLLLLHVQLGGPVGHVQHEDHLNNHISSILYRNYFTMKIEYGLSQNHQR